MYRLENEKWVMSNEDSSFARFQRKNYDYRDKHKYETQRALYARRALQDKDGNRERAEWSTSRELKASVPMAGKVAEAQCDMDSLRGPSLGEPKTIKFQALRLAYGIR